jgi:TM2 domain-containing membrane protein YozV
MPYYVRVRGNMRGPVELPALQNLASQGKLSGAHEVSEDGKNWKPASSYPEIFEMRAERTKSARASVATLSANTNQNESQSQSLSPGLTSDQSVPVNQIREWHYSIDGVQHGPATLSEVLSLIRYQSLSKSDLVWKSSMTQWAPASHVPELVAGFSQGAKGNANRGVDTGPKSKATAIILALFLGSLGIHHFYLGNNLRGILMIVLLLAGIGLIACPIIALVEAILIGTANDETFQTKWCNLGMSFNSNSGAIA